LSAFVVLDVQPAASVNLLTAATVSAGCTSTMLLASISSWIRRPKRLSSIIPARSEARCDGLFQNIGESSKRLSGPLPHDWATG